jgi:hypothetical protein
MSAAMFNLNHTAHTDVLVMMGVLSLASILVLFLPGIRDLRRRVPMNKLIWCEHYATESSA